MDRLRQNVLAARRAIDANAGLVPMVKAEAYGLGMRAVVDALSGFPQPDQPWAFGVAAVAEGERLRLLGWHGRILVFSPASPPEFERAAASGLTLCLSDLAGVERWADLADRSARRLPFHLEIDTGMGRAGLRWDLAAEWGPQVLEASRRDLEWEGIYTHFHSADEPDLTATDIQWDRFRAAVAALPPIDPAPVLHTSNSAAIFRRGGYGCKLARPGIYLYGGKAGPDVEPAPVVSVRARLVLIKEVPAGSSVGYGATYRATRPERWGTLAIGYGDGLPRRLATAGGEVLLRGKRVPIIGRISMDMTTVNLTDLDDAQVGDPATLIGEDGGDNITVDEVATRCSTISYEILTGLGTRLPRIYLGEGGAPWTGNGSSVPVP